MKQELNRLEAYVVYMLNKKGAYDIEVKEEQFISEVQELYQQKEGIDVEKEKVVTAINNLHRVNVVDFSSGNICLKEHVWGTEVR